SRVVTDEELEGLGLPPISASPTCEESGGSSRAVATRYCFQQFVQMVGENTGEDYFTSDGYYYMGKHLIIVQGQGAFYLDPDLALKPASVGNLSESPGVVAVTTPNNHTGSTLSGEEDATQLGFARKEKNHCAAAGAAGRRATALWAA